MAKKDLPAGASERSGSQYWFRVSTWPESPESWLGVPSGCVGQVASAYQSGLVLERLAPTSRSSASECRIVCQRGEIWPESSGWWCWSGRGGRHARLIHQAASIGQPRDSGQTLDFGTRSEEAVVKFPDAALAMVAEIARARRRRSDWVPDAVPSCSTAARPRASRPKWSGRSN